MKRVTRLETSARRGQSRRNRQRQDPRTSDTRRRIRHNEGRESTQFSPGKSFCVYVLPKLTDAMPPIKRVVPLFHSITTPTKISSQRGRSTSIHSTGKDCTVGNCSAARWGAERPAKSGVPENNIPGPRRTPPGFRTADDAANPSDPF